MLSDTGVKFRPHYSFTRKLVGDEEWQITEKPFPNTTQSFRDYSVRSIAEDIKASYCKGSINFNPRHDCILRKIFFFLLLILRCSELEKRIDDGYTLPDGHLITMGAQRFRLADFVFRPESIPVRLHCHSVRHTSESHSLMSCRPSTATALVSALVSPRWLLSPLLLATMTSERSSIAQLC